MSRFTEEVVFDHGEETHHSEEESVNVIAPNVTSTAVATNVLSVTTPTFTFPNLSEEGPSRPPQPLSRGFRRHPRLINREPPAQRPRLSNNINKIPRVMAEWRYEEELLSSNQFGIAVGPTNTPALTMEPLHNTVPTLVLRMIRSEKRTAELRDRTNILRIKVEDQESQIVELESEVEEAQVKIDGLEETVLDLQEKITRMENMFEAISRAATIIPSSPSQ